MNQRPVKTRFPPSPTGDLHIGSARTALFSWLFARHFGGTFILRMEDTDLERSEDRFVETILEGLAWLGIDYDEGPYFQTRRLDRYKEVIEQLLTKGCAYRCVCTKERLEALREAQMASKEKPRYDGHCRDLNIQHPQEPYVVRFRNPLEGVVVFDDMIRGPISVQNAELDDLIIARSDGMPTYNLTVVVDDWDMEITHVIRGDDHINNTPRQINILKALGAPLPEYGHIPMILGSDGKRLSKRHGAASVLEYRNQGILPEALLNYLVRLGWAYGDQEIFSLAEMIQYFDGRNISRSPAAFNAEKLLWLNQHHMKTMSALVVASRLQPIMNALGVSLTEGPPLEAIVSLQAERTKTLQEMAEKSRYFYEEPQQYDPEAVRKHFIPEAKAILEALMKQLTSLTSWNKTSIHEVLVLVSETLQVGLGKIAQPLRIALTGGTVSPPIDDTAALIGREHVLKRLVAAIAMIKE